MADTKAKGYVALRNFDLNGEQKNAGTVLGELSAEDAAPFLAVGVIAELPEESAAEVPAAPIEATPGSRPVFGFRAEQAATE